MSEYTPTTEDVREIYSWVDGHMCEGAIDPQREARFDRWLTAHDAEIRTATLREAAVKLLVSPIGIQITNGIGWIPTNSLAGAARYLQHLGHHAGTE